MSASESKPIPNPPTKTDLRDVLEERHFASESIEVIIPMELVDKLVQIGRVGIELAAWVHKPIIIVEVVILEISKRRLTVFLSKSRHLDVNPSMVPCMSLGITQRSVVSHDSRRIEALRHDLEELLIIGL